MNIFNSSNKLDCSSANPNFVFLASTYWQLLSDSINLNNNGEVAVAKLILSDTVQEFFPKEPSSLNMLPEADVFYGKYAEKFSGVYFELLELWKLIQDGGTSFLTGNEYRTDPKKLENFLTDQKKVLEEIMEDFGVKM